jgi:hypothetical protein
MNWPRLLHEYPPGTLNSIRSTVATLLGYQDILPTDLYVKLNLFRDDLGAAINSSTRPSPAITPTLRPNQATAEPAHVTPARRNPSAERRPPR